MFINLPWIDPIDTLNLPEDFDEKVRQSFGCFTRGTSIEYQFEDKLLYLDNLRRAYLRDDNTSDAVSRLLGESVKYQLEEYGTAPDTEELLSVDFMQTCYDEGFRPLRDFYEPSSSSANTQTLKVILRIVQIIADYSDTNG